MNPGKSGQTGADRRGGITGWWTNSGMMTRASWRLVAVVVALATAAGLALLVAGVGGQLVTTGDAPTPAGVDNHSGAAVGVPDGDIEAGQQLAGLVATEDRTVRGSVDRGAFQTRLDAAGSTAERAQLIDSRLSAVDQQLADLEATVDDLDGDADGATARAVAVGAEAAALDGLLADIEAAMLELPPEERTQHNLTARLTAHDERVATLRERTREARTLVDGTETETWASPVSAADVEEAVDRATSAASEADRLFGSERIDLHVRRANGSTLRLAVDTDGGAVTDIERGPHDNPTVRVYTDYGVVRRLQRADDPGEVLQDALDENRIRYDGVGLFQSLRYGTAGILEWLG